MSGISELAINGGQPVRKTPMPNRGLIGVAEKAAVDKLFDEAIASGNAFGYNGPAEQQYEKDFVEYMGGGFADGVNSGTNAVFCALGGLQLDAFSEVILPPITDPGGTMPVVFLGCVPVIADAQPGSFNTSAAEIEKMITGRTRAIVVAHIAGEPADMDPIMELAKKHNLYVVEDCAQAHGAKYKGRLVGTIGHIAAFSTMFGKHHCTGGQGGVVYTQDEKLHWQARRFADRGKPFNTDAPNNVVAGLNCNLNDLSAAIGSMQLKKLPEIITRRRKVGEALKAGLRDHSAITLGEQTPETEPVYWFLRIKVNEAALTVDKTKVCQALAAEGIPVNPRYEAIPSLAVWFQEKAVFGQSGFPWTAADYKGPREPQRNVKNAVEAIDTHFSIHFHEAYGQPEIDDILAAISKVEQAYLKS